jgi:hypothetical protein
MVKMMQRRGRNRTFANEGNFIGRAVGRAGNNQPALDDETG